MAPEPASTMIFSPIGDARHHAVLREACNYARASNARIELLEVLDGPSAWDRLVHHGHAMALEAEMSSSWRKSFRRWQKEFDEIEHAEVRLGSVARSIVERADEIHASTIILSASDDKVSRAIVTRVMRLSSCPVWVMRSTRAKKRRIMVAVNPEPDELELNLALMRAACRVRDAFGGSLTLMAAWELYGEQTMRQSSFFSTTPGEFHDLFERREGITRRGLEELVAASRQPDAWDIHLAKGAPAPTILRAVQQLRINLLVIGTVGRSGVLGLLMGNTAEDVLEVARCSALTLTPTAARRDLLIGATR